MNHRVEHGGLGLGHLEAVLVLEEFAKISSAVAFPLFEALVGPVRKAPTLLPHCLPAARYQSL